MADALSNALQKLSATNTEIRPRTDYQSGTSEPGTSPNDTVANVDAIAVVATCVSDDALVKSLETSSCTSTLISSVTSTPPESNVGITAQSTDETASTVNGPTATTFEKDISESSALNPVAACDVEAAMSGSESPIRLPMTSAPLPLWKRPIALILEHRRHAAAVVVLICMAGYWFEDSKLPGTNGSSSETLAEDFSDVEAALSEFDVRSAPELKEPAEPIDVSTDFNLTIPMHDTVSSSSHSDPTASEATAAYADSSDSLAMPPSGKVATTSSSAADSRSTGLPAAPVSAPIGSGRSVKARLSHSIQPIN